MSTDGRGPLNALVHFCLTRKPVVLLATLLLIGTGIAVAPFDWDTGLPRSPVPVDAIPNLGENQQIVFADWPGRSPRDVEDQLTYPLSVTLMGVPGVKDVRSLSMLGFSSIAVIFDDNIDFYWSRARLLEKLNSLPSGTLPDGVQPALGPDATALGQVYWYTLEGRDPDGQPTGGWAPHELRSLQDWYVRFALLAAEGISEVASLGGHVREYQIDLDPEALQVHGIPLSAVLNAVRRSNLDMGARTTEINGVEYLVRGVGFIRSLEDIEQAVVRLGPDQTPLRIRDIAHVTLGPADRRGALDINGAEAVGGVVTVREGYNPMQAIHNTRERIDTLSTGLPARAVIDWQTTRPEEVRRFAAAQQLPVDQSWQHTADDEAWLQWLRNHPRSEWPSWLTLSQVTLVPFYDRTHLIQETLGTLDDALTQQLLVTAVVVLALLMHLRMAMAVGLLLPLAVLMSFIAMRLFGIDANIVALAGIAIAIGTIVDMGIIVAENIIRRTRDHPDESLYEQVLQGTQEVGSAVITAIATTVISFLPVFTMTGAEGKLFTPLAWTKTFVLLAAVILTLTLVPTLLQLLLRFDAARRRGLTLALVAIPLLALAIHYSWLWLLLTTLALAAMAFWQLRGSPLPAALRPYAGRLPALACILVLLVVLALVWEPLGPAPGMLRNILFILLLFAALLGLLWLFMTCYPALLRWALVHKGVFLLLPAAVVLAGTLSWIGFDRTLAPLAKPLAAVGLELRHSTPWQAASRTLPGLGREFRPALDEGSFLWMPSTMPHAAISEVLDVMTRQNQAISAIPEVKLAAGKLGRMDSALDPAPLSMIETIIQYHSEYRTDADGRRINFRYDRRRDDFVRDDAGALIPDRRGRPYRQWRDHIQSPDDIWREIVAAAELPGVIPAPKLQPIETRLLMLQTGMRASMGIKLHAPDLDTLEQMAGLFETLLREAPGILPETVNADRVVGKPYLEIVPDRRAIARYGLAMQDVQEAIAMTIGGQRVTQTVEGRERYPVRIRYAREQRNDLEQLERVLIDTGDGYRVPLGQLARIDYVRGPQMIRAENTFLTAYVTFGGQPGQAEVDIVEGLQDYLAQRIADGEVHIPTGVSYSFAGEYQHQQRATRTLQLVIPVALLLIFLILYLQFRSATTALIVFSGIAIAWAGGFIMLHLYGQSWFANFAVFGVNMRDLFQLQPTNLSVAVWVGFLAVFGIAVDTGVVMATYLTQRMRATPPDSVAAVRAIAMEGGMRRLRPAVMTIATTILALLPVLSASGRGADLMIPMAIPSVGGLLFVLLNLITVPVLYAWHQEFRLLRQPPPHREAPDHEH